MSDVSLYSLKVIWLILFALAIIFAWYPYFDDDGVTSFDPLKVATCRSVLQHDLRNIPIICSIKIHPNGTNFTSYSSIRVSIPDSVHEANSTNSTDLLYGHLLFLKMIYPNITDNIMNFDGGGNGIPYSPTFLSSVTKSTREAIPTSVPNGDVEFANLYPAVVQCFAIILCGYLAGRCNLISETESKGLNTFVSNFSLPALIFLSLSKLDFSSVNWLFLLAICLAKTVVFFLVGLVTLLVNRPTNYSKAGLYAIFCTQSNDFALGYPILEALYSKSHPEFPSYLYLLAPVSLAILNPLGFILLEIGKRTNSQSPSSPSTRVSRRTSISSDSFRSSSRASEPLADENLMTSPNNRVSGLRFAGQITQGIILNPIIFMTLLGIASNLIFKHQLPSLLEDILKVLGDAFSASALFALGVRMVGKVSTLRGSSLVVPGILITVKTLMLPLVAREFVSILKPGGDLQDVTEDFSNFGFLYGTFPTAPSVFVFAAHYNIEADMIATGMVAVTFLSAPFMLISAKMITLVNINPMEYVKELETFLFNMSIVGVIAGVWVLMVFICSRKWKIMPHCITLCLIISQLMASVGAMLWSVLDCRQPWQLYLQFTIVTWGVFASRLFTALLAVTLFLMRWKSVEFVQKSRKYIAAIGWGVSGAIVLILVLVVQEEMNKSGKQEPNFQYGTTQAVIALLLLWLSLFTTIVCLILQQRHERRYDTYSPIRDAETSSSYPGGRQGFSLYSSDETSEEILNSTDSSESLFNHNDDLNSPPLPRGSRRNKRQRSVSYLRGSYRVTAASDPSKVASAEENKDCEESKDSSATVNKDEQMTNNAEKSIAISICDDNTNDEPNCSSVQDAKDKLNGGVVNHIEIKSSPRNRSQRRKSVSKRVRRPVSTHAPDLTQPLETSIIRDRDDEFQIMRHVVLLLILCASMMVGFGLCLWTLVTEEVSGVYIEMVFLDAILNYGQSIFTAIVFGLDTRIILLPILRWYRRIVHGDSCVNLPQLNDVPVADIQICDQFTRYHMDKCIRDIVRDRRWRLRRLNGVFGGQDFVDWLLLVGLAHDRTHAVRYGRSLLSGRVIRHIDNLHHFHDQPLFYCFISGSLRGSLRQDI